MTGRNGQATLSGLVVADFTRILAGPLATQVLADLGAYVIKIERPGQGDDTRAWGPPFLEGGDAAYYFAVNRNKHSIALDLTDTDDLETARRIVARSDVLVENYRPNVMSRFGLDYSTLSKQHPGLVYASIPAFAGPSNQDMPGFDLLMQARTGFMSFTGAPDGEPAKMGVAMLDVVAGLYVTVAIQAALAQREQTGRGQRVRVGLFEASIAALVNQATNYLLGGLVPGPAGTAHPNIVPYQGFRSSDGRFVLAVGNEKQYRAACAGMGRPDLATDPRYATNSMRVDNRDELISELESIFEKGTTEHWVELFDSLGVPAAPVLKVDEVFSTPEALATVSEIQDPVRGMLRLVKSPIQGSDLGEVPPAPPPRLGEHEKEIRAWLADQDDT
ncbi:MAG TPA: CoA transferase [Acidimicrobiia bacterium]|nr:CoA transferase [Acidimicrobiia bacterium]